MVRRWRHLHIILVEAGRRQIYPARLFYRRPRMLDFIVYLLIARAQRLPAHFHYAFSFSLDNLLVFVRGSFSENIGAWHNAMLPSRSEVKSRRVNCVVLCSDTSSGWARTFCAVSNSARCRRRKSCVGSESKTSRQWIANFALGFPLFWS